MQKCATLVELDNLFIYIFSFLFLKDARPARWGPPDGWEPPGARSRKVDSLKKKWHELLSKCLSFFRMLFDWYTMLNDLLAIGIWLKV